MVKNLRIYYETNITIQKKIFHRIISLLKKELSFSIASLYIVFVNDETILNLNKKYLKHDYTTDVISLNYCNKNDIIDGEIFISIDTAKFNAKKYRTLLHVEIVRYIIHGILHLIGYDDTTSDKKKKMKALENKLVAKYSSFKK